MEKERRFNPEIEIRELDDGTRVISGYAIVFNSESRDLGGFKEVIAPGSLKNADMTDVVALFNHDTNIPLGRTPATLTLKTTNKGLRYDIKPPETQAAKDLIQSIERGDVKGSSFGFSIAKDGDEWIEPQSKGDIWRRTITSFDRIFDVSPVVYPAYEATDTSVAKRELGVKRDKKEREETEALELEKQKKKIKKEKYLEPMDKWLDEHKVEE